MPSRHLNRRKYHDEFQVQGLYVGDGWVTLHCTGDRDDAEQHMRTYRRRAPLVSYRIECRRVLA